MAVWSSTQRGRPQLCVPATLSLGRPPHSVGCCATYGRLHLSWRVSSQDGSACTGSGLRGVTANTPLVVVAWRRLLLYLPQWPTPHWRWQRPHPPRQCTTASRRRRRRRRREAVVHCRGGCGRCHRQCGVGHCGKYSSSRRQATTTSGVLAVTPRRPLPVHALPSWEETRQDKCKRP